MEKAIETVKSVMANPSLDSSTFKHLGRVLAWLSDSEKLFTPELQRQLSGGIANIDQEQEVGFCAELLHDCNIRTHSYVFSLLRHG